MGSILSQSRTTSFGPRSRYQAPTVPTSPTSSPYRTNSILNFGSAANIGDPASSGQEPIVFPTAPTVSGSRLPAVQTFAPSPAALGTVAPSRPPLPGIVDGEERPEPPRLQDVLDQATANVPERPTEIAGVESTSQLRSLSEVELEAFLEGIAARYGLTREQLVLAEGRLGDMARSLEVQFGRAREEGVEGQQRASSERGILRSGLHARAVGRIDTAISQQRGAATEQRQLQLNEIDAAREAIRGQIATEQAQARTGQAQGLIQFEQGQTVADLLALLPPPARPPPGVLNPASPFLSDPQIPTGPGNAQLFGPTVPQQLNFVPGFSNAGNNGQALSQAELIAQAEAERQAALLAGANEGLQGDQRFF